jgi:hypothetical protein
VSTVHLHLSEANRSELQRPQGMLTVVVLLGALGLSWFALYVWLFLNTGPWLP